MDGLTSHEIEAAVRAALAEDIGSGDVTTLACIPSRAVCHATMHARQRLVVAGLGFAETAFRVLSPNLEVSLETVDGSVAEPAQALLRVSGNARAVLSAERVALNYVQRLSGVATRTSEFVTAISGTRARILDTRKTTPGWRRFEKYAVTCGGGTNHRQGLFDQVLIKDNHLAALASELPNPVAAAVSRCRKLYPRLKVEVEADSLEQVKLAVEAGADVILLDNMTTDQLRAAVALVGGKARTEASGGVSLETVRAIAETGVDFISVGALTHSAPAVDIGLDFES